MAFRSAALDRKQWALFPTDAKSFLLDNVHSMDIYKLVSFWSRPGRLDSFIKHEVKTFTPEFSRTLEALATASYLLAKDYLRKNDVAGARSMILNAGVLNQCEHSDIQDILALFKRGEPPDDDELRMEVPFIFRNMCATYSVETMKQLLYYTIKADISRERDSAPEFVKWNSMESSNKPKPSDSDEQTIDVFVEDRTKTHKMNIPANSSLKNLVSKYAEESGNHSQSLHITHNKKTLFLSSCGRLGLGTELGIKNGDIIKIKDRAVPDKENVSNHSDAKTSSSSAKPRKPLGKSKKKGSKKSTAKPKPKPPPSYQDNTTDENRVKHSRILTGVFEEAEPKFKEIRKKLNELNLERTKPKQKSLSEKFVTDFQPIMNPPTEGTGGKAGKSHFFVQVGEVENLYKSTKPSILRKYSSQTPEQPISLDLHGFSRIDALAKLDSCLSEWIDIAMHGSYPWVIPVTIVCGGGNQVLSEAVENWIRQNDKVSKAPKNWINL